MDTINRHQPKLKRMDLALLFHFDNNTFRVMHSTGARKDMPASFTEVGGQETIMINGYKYSNCEVANELHKQTTGKIKCLMDQNTPKWLGDFK